jgi:hypothetical protein
MANEEQLALLKASRIPLDVNCGSDPKVRVRAVYI